MAVGARTNNFGDLLGPVVVDAMHSLSGLGDASGQGNGRLLSVGSILHFLKAGDVVWGAGCNGKAGTEVRFAPNVRFCAVRGPYSRKLLLGLGYEVPEVFGDPALLLPKLRPELFDDCQDSGSGVVLAPNLHDFSMVASRDWKRILGGRVLIVDPTAPLRDVLPLLSGSETIVASSLHAIILGEILNKVVVRVRAGQESEFKYKDYFAATGRTPHLPCLPGWSDISRMTMNHVLPGIDWDPSPLLEQFPSNLWQGS